MPVAARRLLIGASVSCALILSFSTASAAEPAAKVAWPHVTGVVPRDPKVEARIASLLKSMTLEQKVAQMIQADIRYVTPDDVRTYRLGSILNGGGAFPANNKHAAISDWVTLADSFYDASMDTSHGGLAIPIVWGTDAVHGHNNVVGATLFPHNIGLGAAHDPDLIERIGEATASEVAATGIDWTFAPTLAVVRDDRWGRVYEGYSEDPELVREYAGRMVRGLQGVGGTSKFLDGTRILATAKHYLGDGGTEHGVDRANIRASERELLDIHAQGYLSALQAGVQTVMVSYNSWRGLKVHGDKHLLTDVLKRQLGFDGLVVTDWNAVDEVQACSKESCAQSINAGVDMIMVPQDWKRFLENTVIQVRVGDIPESRIDDAVTRILRVKLRDGLFEKGKPSQRPLANKKELIGAPEHRAVAREAVRKSLVLLENRNNLLPLKPKMRVLVAGDGADDIGKQTGGWTLTWQGTENTNADFPGATSIYAGIRSAVEAGGGTATLNVDGRFDSKPDVAVVVFGENPYAEWHGDLRSLDYEHTGMIRYDLNILRPAPESGVLTPPYAAPDRPAAVAGTEVAPPKDLELLQRLKSAGIPVVAVFVTGRPLWVDKELGASDAFIVAWLPGTEGGGVADVLFRKPDGSINFNVTGKLSFSWPRDPRQFNLNRGDKPYAPRFPYGFGLSYCVRNCDKPSS
jgi:beta-glucosidase